MIDDGDAIDRHNQVVGVLTISKNLKCIMRWVCRGCSMGCVEGNHARRTIENLVSVKTFTDSII